MANPMDSEVDGEYTLLYAPVFSRDTFENTGRRHPTIVTIAEQDGDDMSICRELAQVAEVFVATCGPRSISDEQYRGMLSAHPDDAGLMAWWSESVEALAENIRESHPRLRVTRMSDEQTAHELTKLGYTQQDCITPDGRLVVHLRGSAETLGEGVIAVQLFPYLRVPETEDGSMSRDRAERTWIKQEYATSVEGSDEVVTAFEKELMKLTDMPGAWTDEEREEWRAARTWHKLNKVWWRKFASSIPTARTAIADTASADKLRVLLMTVDEGSESARIFEAAREAEARRAAEAAGSGESVEKHKAFMKLPSRTEYLVVTSLPKV